MKLFNTRTQQLEPFEPTSNKVALYACGTAAYEGTYLSQVFTYCFTDVLVRYLMMKGNSVKSGYCISDVDSIVPDDEAQVITGGRQSPANRWLACFIEDLQLLNVRPPDHMFDSTFDCSQEAAQLMGEAVDIHIGSADSRLHNHQHELDQVESINNRRPSVRFWLQTAPAEQEPQAMNNSLRDLETVRDLLKRFSPDALRIYLAQYHYRVPWTHDEVALERATRWIGKLEAALTAASTGHRKINVTPAQNRFTAAMDNDLDTGKAIASLLNLADEILFRAPNAYLVDEAQAVLRHMASVFGVRLDGEVSRKRVTNGWNEQGI